MSKKPAAKKRSRKSPSLDSSMEDCGSEKLVAILDMLTAMKEDMKVVKSKMDKVESDNLLHLKGIYLK